MMRMSIARIGTVAVLLLATAGNAHNTGFIARRTEIATETPGSPAGPEGGCSEADVTKIAEECTANPASDKGPRELAKADDSDPAAATMPAEKDEGEEFCAESFKTITQCIASLTSFQVDPLRVSGDVAKTKNEEYKTHIKWLTTCLLSLEEYQKEVIGRHKGEIAALNTAVSERIGKLGADDGPIVKITEALTAKIEDDDLTKAGETPAGSLLSRAASDEATIESLRLKAQGDCSAPGAPGSDVVFDPAATTDPAPVTYSAASLLDLGKAPVAKDGSLAEIHRVVQELRTRSADAVQ